MLLQKGDNSICLVYSDMFTTVQTVLHPHAAIRVTSSHQFSGHLIYTFQLSTFSDFNIAKYYLTRFAATVSCFFACHKFSLLCVRQDPDPFTALRCSFLLLFSLLFYCGTKNVKAVKGCSVFYESLSSLVIETNVIHSKVTEGYLYERKGL